MKKIIFFLVLFWKVSGTEFSSPSGEAIFQEFMSDLFQTTTAGYVIFGRKPLNLCTFGSLRSHIAGSDGHRLATLGLLCQAFLRDVPRKENWIFTIHQPTHLDTYELLIGNRSLLTTAIQAHLELFQIKFGLDVKPHELLNRLEQSGFGTLFRGAVALQGIILGYGYENAISCERLVKSNYKKMDEFHDFTHYIPLSPSDHTMIPFSYHANLPSNRALLSRYRQDHRTLEHILKKPNWSKQVLSTCFKTIPPFTPAMSKTFSIPQTIASSIRNSCSIYFSPQFIQGMEAADAGKALSEPQAFLYFDYFYREDFATENGRNNRIFSDRFFQTEAIHQTVLIPRRLAMRILKEGIDTTQTVAHPQDGLFLYNVKTLDGAVIGGSFYAQEAAPIPEKELFPGLACGVIGMHPGEERELLIHPDLFYGTAHGDGKPVIVRIVCHGIIASPSSVPPPSLLPINMRQAPLSITTPAQFATIQSKIEEWAGWQTWMHYKGACSLQEVLQLIQADGAPLTAQEELDQLLFEWQLYKQKKEALRS